MAGKLLAGVAEAAVIAVALGVASALLVRLLALAPPSRPRSHTMDAQISTAMQSTDDAKDGSSRARDDDVCKDPDAGGPGH